MMNRDEIIMSLTEIAEQPTEDGMVDGVNRQTIKDALELLKEQEPVTMKPYYFNYVCSGCGSEIDGEFIDYTCGKIKFCPECGSKVKWDDD